jgi:hypothetical protein
MASSANKTIGVKGSDVYDSTGSALLDLSVLLVRNAPADSIQSLLQTILAENTTQADDDAFVLAFQTRDIRGGKGERDLFTLLFSCLLKERPTLAPRLLDFIPEYGSWRDIFVLLDIYVLLMKDAHGITNTLLALVKEQLIKDETDMAAGKSISLLAKWMPREGSHDDKLAKRVASYLFPHLEKVSYRLKAYRKRIVPLNKYLETTEVKMCAKQFATIEPSAVPGRCLAQHMKAFLNEPTQKSPHKPMYRPRLASGLRYPEDKDRMECREHFQEHLAKAKEGKVKINGSVTRYPHEIIKKIVTMSVARSGPCYCSTDDCIDCESGSDGERDALIAVWNDMVKKGKEAGGLGKSVAMSDFSGSMQSSYSNRDTPYWVSMAMGLLISELTSDEFKNTFMSFDSEPKWHTLPEGDIFERVQSISPHLGQGTSTDFQKALDKILETLKEKRVRPGDEPKDLIVITDMNFDAACGSHEASSYTGNRYRHVVKTESWQTHVEMAREAFKRAGEDMWGQGNAWTPPRIVIWNVAATSQDFHAQKDEEGVIHLSGWSPSLFKVLMEEGSKVQTPMDALRVMLDAERYQPIRQRLAELRKPLRVFTTEIREALRDTLRLEEA